MTSYRSFQSFFATASTERPELRPRRHFDAPRPASNRASRDFNRACGVIIEKLEGRELLSAGTFTQNQAVTIADLATVRSTMNISGMSGTLTDINFALNATHTWDSDLRGTLTSPSGTSVILFDRVGGSGDNFTGTTLDDEASAAIISGTAPFAGTFRPQAALSAFDGQDPNGPWVFTISDLAGGDSGTLKDWSIALQTSSGSTGGSGVFNTNRGQAVDAPLRGDPNNRNPDLYNRVIDQFQLASNPRYAADNFTYCNIASWDITRAMGAEIPHYVLASQTYGGRFTELNANRTFDWLNSYGSTIGYRRVSTGAEAQRLANLGHPAVAVWRNPSAGPDGQGESGHIMVIRPGTWTDTAGATIAQAGGYVSNGLLKSNNFSTGKMFGPIPGSAFAVARNDIAFWVNDTGRTSQSNQPLSAPTNLRAMRTGIGAFRLDWMDNASNESGYRGQFWNGTAWQTFAELGANTVTMYINATPGYTFRLRIVAVNLFGEATSNEISIFSN